MHLIGTGFLFVCGVGYLAAQRERYRIALAVLSIPPALSALTWGVWALRNAQSDTLLVGPPHMELGLLGAVAGILCPFAAGFLGFSFKPPGPISFEARGGLLLLCLGVLVWTIAFFVKMFQIAIAV
jgi:hypothetical protein